MTAPLQNQVDDAQIKAIVAAMTHTDGECDAAQRSVDGATSYLNSVWKGDASGKFNDAISSWQAGLRKVQSALRDLNDAMTQHYHISNTVEQDNSAKASWT